MLKHVIVERVQAGREDDFVALTLELRVLMQERGWRHYRAWRAFAADVGEPGMFDVGILGRAVVVEGAVGFECDFDDREQLEAQLQGMRSDPEVVKVLLRAMETLDASASRSYILEDWWPPMPADLQRRLDQVQPTP